MRKNFENAIMDDGAGAAIEENPSTDKITNKRVDEDTNDFSSYFDAEKGVALIRDGDNVYIYNLNETKDTASFNDLDELRLEDVGKNGLVAKIKCPDGTGAEFISEFQERLAKVEFDNDNPFGVDIISPIGNNEKDNILEDMSYKVRSQLKEENTFSTGDAGLDNLKEKYEDKVKETKSKIDDLEKTLEDTNSEKMKPILTKLLEEQKAELEKYEEKIDKLEQLEVKHAAEEKENITNMIQKIDEKLEFLEEYPELNTGKFGFESSTDLNAERDELQDRLDAIDRKFGKDLEVETETVDVARESNSIDDFFDDDKTLESTKSKAKVELEEDESVFDKIRDKVNELRNNVKDIIDDVKDGDGKIQLIEDIKEAASEYANNLQADVSGFCVDIDNMMGDFYDRIKNFAKENLNSEQLQALQEVSSAVATGYAGLEDKIKDISEFIADKVSEYKERVSDACDKVEESVKEAANEKENANETTKDVANEREADTNSRSLDDDVEAISID